MGEELIAEENKITTKYEVKEGKLLIKKTPEKVVETVETYDMEEVLMELSKCNTAIESWTAKKAGLEAIVNKYNDLNEVVEEA